MVCKKLVHWRRILGIRLRSWKENADFSLEKIEFATSKENTSIEIQMWKTFLSFLRYWRNCLRWVRTSRHHCELEIIQSPVSTMYDENARKSWRMDLCCFMTTLSVTRFLSSASFLADKIWPCALIHHSHRTWHSLISGYFQKLNLW
jgi:hypothetical protein